MKPHLEVGYIARARGLLGEVGVKTFERSSQTLLEVRRLLLRTQTGERALQIASARPAGPKEIVLTLEGIQGREASERLVGAVVLVFREDLAPPREGEYFQGDLIGLTAVDSSGAVLGVVEDLWSHGPVPNLVIRAEGRPELLVPFADEFVPEVRLADRRIVVRPPELAE